MSRTKKLHKMSLFENDFQTLWFIPYFMEYVREKKVANSIGHMFFAYFAFTMFSPFSIAVMAIRRAEY